MNELKLSLKNKNSLYKVIVLVEYWPDQLIEAYLSISPEQMMSDLGVSPNRHKLLKASNFCRNGY